MSEIDFETIKESLHSNALSYLEQWLPGGKVEGPEFVCGSIRGEPGKSFKVNLNKFVWSDFATGESGSDLISLYAKIKNLKQIEAAKELSNAPKIDTPKIKSQLPEIKIISPATVNQRPDFTHYKFGKPIEVYAYKNKDSQVMMYIAKYIDQDNKKTFTPFCYSDKGWVRRQHPVPRPLYGVDLIKDPSRKVMIVEGEKSVIAARKIFGDRYYVVTWPGGSKAVNKSDWSMIKDKEIIVWPDADTPGMDAAREIASIAFKFCKSVKVIDVLKGGKVDGWDAADALAEGMTAKQFFEWAKPLVKESFNEVIKKEITQPKEKIYTPEVVIHQDKGDVHSDEIATAFEVTPAIIHQWDNLGVLYSSRLIPFTNIENAYNIISRYKKLKDCIWFDTFHQKYFTKLNSSSPRLWGDTDPYMVTYILQKDLFLKKITPQIVEAALLMYANDNQRNEVQDWIKSLKWDGHPRIQQFFPNYMGAEHSEYTCSVSKNFWVSMVARVMRPGCKVDNMVILEGAQGAFKSSALKTIGGDWYVACNENINSKDFYLTMQGNLIIEIAELDSFNKSEANTIKKVVSCEEDIFRKPYGRKSESFPRQCVFVGTTNDHEYLRDHTGSRRFWPISTSVINLEKIKDDREQLFAEAYQFFLDGSNWYQVPASAKDIQEERSEADAWETIIADYCIGKFELTTLEVARNALEIPVERIDYRAQRRISKILKKFQWENKTIRHDEKVLKKWVRESV